MNSRWQMTNDQVTGSFSIKRVVLTVKPLRYPSLIKWTVIIVPECPEIVIFQRPISIVHRKVKRILR